MPNDHRTFRLVGSQASDGAEPMRSGKATGDSMKAEFIAAQKARCDLEGWPFDQAKVEQQFDAIDVHGDGIASGKEKTAYWNKVTERNVVQLMVSSG